MRVVSTGTVAVLCVVLLGGCVSKWSYDEQVAIADHLRTVKTEQDIERDGLHADVQALNRAYSGQSMRLTGMEGVVMHATNELKAIQTRLGLMGQEQTLLRGEVTKLGMQANETLQFLRTINEQQQATNASLTGMSTKLDSMKRPAPAKAARMVESIEGKDRVDGGSGTVDLERDKSAVQRAIDQKLGYRPAKPGIKPVAKPSDGPPLTLPEQKVSMDSGTSDGVPQTAVKPDGAAPVLPGAGPGVGPTTMGPKPSDVVSSPTASLPVGPAKGLDPVSIVEPSPLARKTEPVKQVTPVKQTWMEWIGEKLGRKKPVQTAAQEPAPRSAAPSAKPYENKDVIR